MCIFIYMHVCFGTPFKKQKFRSHRSTAIKGSESVHTPCLDSPGIPMECVLSAAQQGALFFKQKGKEKRNGAGSESLILWEADDSRTLVCSAPLCLSVPARCDRSRPCSRYLSPGSRHPEFNLCLPPPVQVRFVYTQTAVCLPGCTWFND